MNPNSKKRTREDSTIERALAILKSRFERAGERYQADSPGAIKRYLQLKLGSLEREVFHVVFLDNGLRAFALEEMFLGTLTQTAVYPREIARAALRLNAAAVVLVHNHPSGVAAFSEDDRRLTERVRAALDLIDINVVDHLLVARDKVASYATGEAVRDSGAMATSEHERLRRRARLSAALKASWARRRAAARAAIQQGAS